MKKFLLLLTLILISSDINAAYKQKLTVCLKVENNNSDYHFQAGFKSTDFFDHSRYSNKIQQGESCVSHTYQNGPKDISIGIGSDDAKSKIHIRVLASCRHFYFAPPGWVGTDTIGTRSPEQVWKFTLTQSPIQDQTYNLSCDPWM